MESSSLRIGNLVFDLNKNIVEVSTISLKGIEFFVPDGYGQNDCDLIWENWLPIPITEEWLLKFGFRKIEGSNVWNNGIGNYNYSIHQTLMLYPFDVRSNDPFTYFIKTPKYVHELQNLFFSLTDEELQVNPKDIALK